MSDLLRGLKKHKAASAPPAPRRRFDTTSCQSTDYAGIVHRDYFAHCFRWGWASRHISAPMRVLDVGCGVDVPLARVLSRTGFPKRGGPDQSPGSYVGVDMNTELRHQGFGKTVFELRPAFNFVERYAELGLFDRIVNFEVIEHMAPVDGDALLVAMRECLKPDGMLILSTPVLHPTRGQAANHIHEYLIPELQESIERAGLTVERRLGTFASYQDIKKVLSVEQSRVFEDVRAFYGDDVTSCFFAPMYPDASRNNVWMCRRADRGQDGA